MIHYLLICSTVSHGLPTRSRTVAQYMIGLEKTKAKAGEISQSMRALTLSDMKKLHDHCLRPDQSLADLRWGVVRWVSEYRSLSCSLSLSS